MPPRRRGYVLPLKMLPPATRERIAEAVAQPKPPPRWLSLGDPAHPRPIAQIRSRAWWEWHWQRGIYPEERRDWIPPWLRAQVIDRDGLVCQLCGGDVPLSDLHIDHIYPRSRGGRDVLGNLQVAHSMCNIRKGARISWHASDH